MGCVWVNQWSRVCMYGLCLGESVVVCLCMSYVRVFIYMNMGKALSRRMKWSFNAKNGGFYGGWSFVEVFADAQ